MICAATLKTSRRNKTGEPTTGCESFTASPHGRPSKEAARSKQATALPDSSRTQHDVAAEVFVNPTTLCDSGERADTPSHSGKSNRPISLLWPTYPGNSLQYYTNLFFVGMRTGVTSPFVSFGRFSPLAEEGPIQRVAIRNQSSASVDVEIVDSLNDVSSTLLGIAGQVATSEQVDRVEELLLDLQRKLEKNPKTVKQVEHSARDKVPHWGEWKSIESDCHSFDKHKVQHILMASALPQTQFKHIGTLRKVPWRAIIDLDPNSEESGLYKAFSIEEDRQTLNQMWVPGRILEIRSGDLESEINWRRSPWLFANGRTKDSQANQPQKSGKQGG